MGQSAQVLAQVYRYDQLNRLKRSQGVTGITATNTWHDITDAVSERYLSEYTYDANGNIEAVARYDQDGHLYDDFSYKYKRDGDGRLLQNRLYQLNDLADEDDLYVNEGPGGAEDIAWTDDVAFDPQDGAINTAYNYGYDALGNLVRDTREEIAAIEWTVAGKVKSVARTTGSTRRPLTFGYGADGQRIMKQVGEDPDLGAGHREYYVRDAQGNIMATYRYTNPTGSGQSFKVMERPIYGSSRLGSYDRPRQLLGSPNIPAVAVMSHPAKRYELTDHLGNVNTVVTGRLLPGNGAGSLYQAEVISATLHEPFGLNLTGMNWQSDQARFGFQGQIKELEMNAIHFKYREYSLDGGGFWSVDPLAAKYPWNSPYAFSENRVIDSNELEGLETIPGGQVVTSDDLLARPIITTATESTITPLTQWDSNLILPSSRSPFIDEPSLVLYAVDNFIRKPLSGGLLLGTTIVGGLESGGRHAAAKFQEEFSNERVYPSRNFFVPTSLDENFRRVNRESLMHGNLTPTEGSEVVGATIGIIGLGTSGFINTGNTVVNKAMEFGIKGAVNYGITTGISSLEETPPAVTDEEIND